MQPNDELVCLYGMYFWNPVMPTLAAVGWQVFPSVNDSVIQSGYHYLREKRLMSAAKILSAAALALLVAGCVDQTKVVRSSLAVAMTLQLKSNVVGYVTLPEAGTYRNRRYERSGEMTMNALADAFGRHLAAVKTGRRLETLEQGLASAKDSGATYLIYPQILHWEDRATEWSGKPDRMEVKVSVLEVETGEVLDWAVLSGVSKLGTLGGDHPQDMLPVPARTFADELFQ